MVNHFSSYQRRSGALQVVVMMLVISLGIAVADAKENILYSWVQLMDNDKDYLAIAQVRAIVQKDAKCKELEIKYIDEHGGQGKLGMNKRDQPDKGFDRFKDIEVCNAELTGEQITKSQSITVAGPANDKTLHIPDLSQAIPLNRIVLVGDTGCRNEEGKQLCDKENWPFETIVNDAVGNLQTAGDSEAPPLIIHLGDFRYYETDKEDVWDSKAGGWETEFFKPAANLLDKGPWVFLRGNHEQCLEDKDVGIDQETGEAFLYFFGNKNNKLSDDETRCNKKDQLDAHAIDVKHRNRTLRLVFLDLIHKVLDVKWYKTEFSAYVADEFGKYKDAFDEIEEMIADEAATPIMVAHIPIFGLKGRDDGPEDTVHINPAHILLDALNASKLADEDEGKAIERVPLMLSGHSHNCQLTDPNVENQDFRRPYQYIIGNSGVSLSMNDFAGKADVIWTPYEVKKGQGRLEEMPNLETWTTLRKRAFGYMIIHFSSDGGRDTATFTPYLKRSGSEYTAEERYQCRLNYQDGSAPELVCPGLSSL